MIEHIVEILLVKANPNNVTLTLHALHRYHFTNHIQVVRDGVEALEFLFCIGAYAHCSLTQSPKVVLLDLKLLLVSGLEVPQRIKAAPRTHLIPVVVLTSAREDRDIVDSYCLGGNSYITKPVDFEQFTEVVHAPGMYWVLLNQPPTWQAESATGAS